jgi:radical SAM protein with 4Fe4S-binding SPASM domain
MASENRRKPCAKPSRRAGAAGESAPVRTMLAASAGAPAPRTNRRISMAKTLDFTFNSYHFVAGHPHARELFKSSVSNVEVEVSSYCNRVCSFCPNAFIDRRSAQHYMNDALYTRILTDLASIDYEGRFCFHRYNEPLADRDYILKRVRESRAALPRARLKIYTNGDYLTADYLEALADAGLDDMLVTVYLGEHQAYTDELVRERVMARLASLGLPYRILQREPGIILARVDWKPGRRLLVRGKSFEQPTFEKGIPETVDRGGSVAVNAAYHRRSPCMMVFSELQVELDGSVVPCCNIRTDNPEHRSYKIGTIGQDASIFDVWTNAAHTEWRRRLFTFGEKDPPCGTCSYAVQIETSQKREQLQAAAIQLGLAVPA